MLSLNQLEKASAEDKSDPNGLYHWARLFLSTCWEDLIMEAKANPNMQSFVGTVKKLTAEEQIALACENRLRYSNEMASYDYMVKQAEEKTAIAKQELSATEEKLSSTEEKLSSATKDLEAKDRLIAELKAQLEAK